MKTKMRFSNSLLYLNRVTSEALDKVNELDREFIGTRNYMGVCCFWGDHPYKEFLQDLTPAERRRVHKHWMYAGLDFEKESRWHYKIIGSVIERHEKACAKTQAEMS